SAIDALVSSRRSATVLRERSPLPTTVQLGGGMKVSEAWLREFADPPDETRALLERLTMAGLKIESAEAVAGEFSGVFVADVRSVERHPDAGKLSVCRVWDGLAEQQVVCGAPNVRVGMQAAFARPGARLPGGAQISRSTVRGIDSNGMLCSGAELGIDDD